MSSLRLIIAVFFVFIFASSVAQARDVALMASACAACHGTNGHSVTSTPKLAGLDELYFIQQMTEFRTGERSSTVMIKYANGYSEAEIRALAAYFAVQ